MSVYSFCDHMLVVCISPSFKPVILKILIVIKYGGALIQLHSMCLFLLTCMHLHTHIYDWCYIAQNLKLTLTASLIQSQVFYTL